MTPNVLALVCACGAKHTYTRDSYRRAVRLGRRVACSDCRAGRTLAGAITARPIVSTERGRTGYSRSLNDKIFKPGTGRKGFGAWTDDGRLLATQTNESVLREWYPDCRIERLEK
jgi:hypothetical protein